MYCWANKPQLNQSKSVSYYVRNCSMRVKTVHNACAWKFARVTAAVLFALISGLHAPVPTERRCVRMTSFTLRSQACRLCATVECNKHPAWHRFLRRRRSWVNSELTPDSRPPPSSPPLAPTDRPYNGKSTSAHFRCVGPRHPVQSVSR